jgi:hypothetical protein
MVSTSYLMLITGGETNEPFGNMIFLKNSNKDYELAYHKILTHVAHLEAVKK